MSDLEPTSPAIPAAWLPDPQNPNLSRYWDGTAWTENTAPTAPTTAAPLASTKIVVSAPMSFAGSTKRMNNWFSGWMFWVFGLPLLLAWWSAILCWYVVFGIFLVPYRLIRRGGRKRKLADARHQEMLAMMQQRR